MQVLKIYKYISQFVRGRGCRAYPFHVKRSEVQEIQGPPCNLQTKGVGRKSASSHLPYKIEASGQGKGIPPHTLQTLVSTIYSLSFVGLVTLAKPLLY